MAALLAASLTAAQAQSMITDWSFTSAVSPGYNTPAPTFGSGSATQMGMNNSYTFNGNEGPGSVASCDVTSSTGDSLSTGFGWRVRGLTNVGNLGPGNANGWNSQAPIGTQGAQFLASTLGYNNIKLTFDLQTTAQATRNLEVLYTLNGTTWNNATITSAGSGVNGGVIGTIKTGSLGDSLTVNGSYMSLSSTAGWNNQISVDFSSIAGANNDANFGIEIVNASTGADDVNVAGNALNNSSGNWRLNNVEIQGVPEPSMLALAALGLTSLFFFRQRQQRKA